jgi:hypothetical protein
VNQQPPLKKSATIIFALVDPRDQTLLAIEATHEDPQVRIRRQLRHVSHHNLQLAAPVSDLLSRGIQPGSLELERTGHDDWRDALEFWREYFGMMGSKATSSVLPVAA